MRIAINGLGRIGRAIIRAAKNYPDIEIIAANGTSSAEEYSHLLKYDSVHGKYEGSIEAKEDSLIVDSRRIKLISQRQIELLNWLELEVDLVMECTGQFNKKEKASKHIKNGAKKVLVSAPCQNADATIVYGINNHVLDIEHEIISIGSCTTNALAPIAKILNDKIGIESGFMSTIHSYTNDQNLLDGTHKDLRRARACSLSIIPTSTGAAKTIGLILPELDGKISGSAIRVPTPNVSLIDLCFNSKIDTNKNEINAIIKKAADQEYKNIVYYSNDQLVSIDYNHSPYSVSFDPFETNVVNGKLCRVLGWYDNEWGFANRMLDVARIIPF